MQGVWAPVVSSVQVPDLWRQNAAQEKEAEMKPVEDGEFFCRCKGGDTARCDEVLAKAREIADWSDTYPLKTDIDFVDRMLFSLAVDGDLRIAADQWSGVSYKRYVFNKETHKYEEGPSCYFQCDSPTDGIAGAFVWAHQQEEVEKGGE